jgi:hypothetical protein
LAIWLKLDGESERHQPPWMNSASGAFAPAFAAGKTSSVCRGDGPYLRPSSALADALR